MGRCRSPSLPLCGRYQEKQEQLKVANRHSYLSSTRNQCRRMQSQPIATSSVIIFIASMHWLGPFTYSCKAEYTFLGREAWGTANQATAGNSLHSSKKRSSITSDQTRRCSLSRVKNNFDDSVIKFIIQFVPELDVS
uniref:Uncharacterized protein n=1 Tax=Minutocellus polymorphus TaxID=265543 RepID=A0A7S0ALR1_9STRA|mmetsp:Transcript_17140/g.28554  ORF Transcript_17140/g.28554 Transcript_17140/m.28554 type:complete len:137 (+) Transcript_17140:178-588(+)